MSSYGTYAFSLDEQRKQAENLVKETVDNRTFRYDTKKLFPNVQSSIHYVFYTSKKLTVKEARERVLSKNKDFKL